jgi:hypothetical protein
MMTLSYSNKKFCRLMGRVLIRSSLKPRKVAALVAERLIPNGGALEWKVLDGEEIPLLGLGGLLGGELELEGDEVMQYVLSYSTDHRYVDHQERKTGVAFPSTDFTDVTPMLMWILGEIPGLTFTPVEFSG